MRKGLRKAIKDGYQNIAVVCGAWHTPALADLKAYKVKDDNALLRGIPKVKTVATWIPWTYQRLAYSSGYGAGVVSPAWYELLFSQPTDATVLWMAKIAQLFKENDLDSSAAHAIEAVRLATTLAALRGVPVPGILELQEAVRTVFSNGFDSSWQLVEEQLVIGDKMGTVPDSIPVVPLQKDFEQRVKNLKLSKYKSPERQWLKASKARPQGGLDLREEHDRKQSAFLHRLVLLSIPWGTEERGSGREISTKNEYWQMKWDPSFAIALIEANMWGNTVEKAAERLVQKHSAELEQLTELVELLGTVLYADLPQALQQLLYQIGALAAETKDTEHLMQVLPVLAQILRYGDVRDTDILQVESVVNELVPRICVGLKGLCCNVADEVAQPLFMTLREVHRALVMMNKQPLILPWVKALKELVNYNLTHPLIAGGACRILSDMQLFEPKEVQDQVAFALSNLGTVQEGSAWLEGFLHGSGLLLIHNPELWTIIDTWIKQLAHLDFQALLPALRRTFSNFSTSERQKMLQLGKHENKQKTTNGKAVDTARAAAVLPVLKLLLQD